MSSAKQQDEGSDVDGEYAEADGGEDEQDDDDDSHGDDNRPSKRSKIRRDSRGMDDEEELDNEDGSDEEDEEEDEDEEYKEKIRKTKWKISALSSAAAVPVSPIRAVGPPSCKSTSTILTDDNNKDRYIPLPIYGEHKRAVSSVKFAPSRLVKKDRPTAAICASSSADGYIKLWNIDRETLDAAMGAMKKASNETTTTTGADGSAATEASNKHNMSASLEASVTCGGHTRGINDVAWNPVSPFLASASDDKTVRLWDMVTGDALVEYRGHDSFVFCVDQYQHMIVSGSFDETVKLWDIRSGDCVATLPAHSDPVTSVSFNRDGTVVCTGSHDGLIRLWDVATGECLKTIYAAGNPPVSSAKFSPNSKYILASTLMDSTLRLWPVHRTGSNLCAKTFSNAEHHVNQKYSIVADFMFDGNIVTGSETGKVVLYDLQSQQVLQVLDCHEDVVLAVSAHNKLPLIASGAMMNDRRVHFCAPKSFSF